MLMKLINNYIQFQGLPSLEKRKKVFEYLKNCISNNGFMFLQKTHSIVYDEKRWQDDFEGKLFFHTSITTLVEWLLVS